MIALGTPLSELDTPSLLVDLRVLEANIARMAAFAKEHNVSLRPHVKTHKTPEIAHRQLAAGATGITVAKVSEAEVFAAAGVKDIFIAYPTIGEQKLRRVLELARHVRVIVGIDSEEGARQLSAAVEKAGIQVEVRLEVDVGLNRSGIDREKALDLAKLIADQPGLNLEGIFTFRGIFYAGGSDLDLDRAGKEEGQLMVDLADKLRAQGLAVRSISVGSTPTALAAGRVPGITELRPGTYVFNDMMQVRVGAARLEDCAASVLVTVASRPTPDRAIIDGGSKTFAADYGPGIAPLNLPGYGTVLGFPDAVFQSMSEEHGILRLGPNSQAIRVADKLRIIPNHICTVVNLFDQIIAVRDDKVEAVWPIAARGQRC